MIEKYKWLRDSDDWTESTYFNTLPRSKKPHPCVGDVIHEWTILGTWIDKLGIIKAYKTKCSCGRVKKYMQVNTILAKKSKQCKYCQISKYKKKIDISNNSYRGE